MRRLEPLPPRRPGPECAIPEEQPVEDRARVSRPTGAAKTLQAFLAGIVTLIQQQTA